MTPCIRNQFRGVITHIGPGAANSAVRIRIGEQQTLTAVVTDTQQLHVGAFAVALVKASWVLVGKEGSIGTGQRNKLTGRITRITAGPVDSDIIMDLGQGRSISALVSNANAAAAQLREGDIACAFFKASSVVVTSH